MSRPRILALLLGLVTLLVYLPVWRCDFVDYDDDDYVTNNPEVKKGLTLDGTVWAFNGVYAENWHPLTWLSHMADCQFFGLNPHAHHAVSALIHAANAALLFGLLFRLTAKIWPSLLVAALFAWHPLHVESVAWIAERKDVLSTFFALWALLSYVQYRQENRRSHFWLAVGFFALALMAKPMVVTLPFVFLLLDYWPLNRVRSAECGMRNLKALLAEKWPFFLLVVASCIITLVAQSQSFRGGVALTTLTSVPLAERLKNVPVAYVSYLLKIFWPAKLAVFYPLEKITPAGLVAGATLILAVISKLIWSARLARPYLLMGWLWFLGTLVPVIGLVQVGGAALADRYTYVPAIGIFIGIVFMVCDVAARFPLAKILFAGSAMVLAACIGLTERQLSFWRDSETLFRHALAVTPDNDIARSNLGHILLERGKMTEALAEYRAAAKLSPGRALAHNNLANVLDLLGQPAEALAEYRISLQLMPDDASQHTGAGYELGQLGQYDAALVEFVAAEKLAPRYPAPHVQAAQVYFKMGQDADGIKEFSQAIALAPNNWGTLAALAHHLAANENAAMRDGPAAMKLAAKASLLTGGSAISVCDVLGMACAETGDFADAIDSVQHAIDLATAAKMTNTGPFQQRLELYRQNKPWREPFRAPAAVTNSATNKLP